MRMTCAHDVHAPVLACVYERREVKPKFNVPFQNYARLLPNCGHPMFTGGQVFS